MRSLRSTAVVVSMLFGTAGAENIIFPDDAGVIDVAEAPYYADNRGNDDATDAIQQALDDYANGHRTIYLPNGTYLVSDRLLWGPENNLGCGTCQKRTHLQGQSRDGTIIRLKDNCNGYQDPDERKPVVVTGYKPAQRFRNCISNLTVHTGSGNPGACGIQYNTSNQGSVRHVKIISGDRTGTIGLDCSFTGEIGPGLVYDLEVVGFDYGVKTSALNSITIDSLVLKDQKICGLRNSSHVVTLCRVRSNNAVAAIENTGVMTLVDAHLRAGEASAAIENGGTLYARSIQASGYGSTINNEKGNGETVSGYVVEFVSHDIQSLFESTPTSLHLPTRFPPRIPWDQDLTNWANPMNYGAAGDGKTDDTRAVQEAIDDNGKTTVYFPGGKQFKIEGELLLRGTISRMIFCGGKIRNATLRFVDGEADAVICERFDNLYYDATLTHESDRTLILSGTTHIHVVSSTGTGDLFLRDFCAHHMDVNPTQNVWAWQVNTENNRNPQSEINTVNDGGVYQLFGLKTENWGTKIHTKNSGYTELLGAWIYANGNETKTEPVFSIDDGFASFAGIRTISFSGYPFIDYVKETRGSDTRTLSVKDAGAHLALYTGHGKQPTIRSRHLSPPAPALRSPTTRILLGGRHRYSRGAGGETEQLSKGVVYSVQGRCVPEAMSVTKRWGCFLHPKSPE